ncbi:MAG: dTDP-4-dehydrorhamnose 3,5-epimerase [Balneolaceae bacterium]
MIAEKLRLNGACLLKPKIFRDERGYFLETFRDNFFCNHIANIEFVQENQSGSKKNVLRGLHYQEAPYEQSKLVRVIKGCIQDLMVDLRPDSKTFGEYISIILSEDNKYQLFIPKGFAHGFLSLEENTIVVYKVDSYYAPEFERCLRWDDPEININWSVKSRPIVSDKDRKGYTFKKIKSNLKK